MPFFLYMLLSLPFIFMALLLVLYLYVVSKTTSSQNQHSSLVKSTKGGGLSDVQLQKVPKITGKELSQGNDCAICLDVIENDQPARLVPGCNHAFHLECVDIWLSKQPFCPVCRHKLEPELFSHDESNQC